MTPIFSIMLMIAVLISASLLFILIANLRRQRKLEEILKQKRDAAKAGKYKKPIKQAYNNVALTH